MDCPKCDNVISDRTAQKTLKCQWCGANLPVRPFTYLNVYSITREYGGPEEGGWWYDQWIPICCYLLTEEDQTRQFELEEEFQKKYEAEYAHGDISSVLGGEAIQARLEYEFGRPNPECRPHYE